MGELRDPEDSHTSTWAAEGWLHIVSESLAWRKECAVDHSSTMTSPVRTGPIPLLARPSYREATSMAYVLSSRWASL